jgi:phosphate:Na+ symporter
LRGTFWGAVVTLAVQSSSATTMTTIGLVSADLLTFAQGLSLVFGANIGTTGTGWLVALLGVRVSLTAAALPMIFVGALIKLLGRGRVSAAGAAFAGFALVLLGLTTLQQGMGGLSEQLHPADLPAVLGAPGAGFWSGALGVLALVLVGLAMTAVMQSSTAAIAVTLSAHYAGAIGLDQAMALVIGQNIGTATSSALAAIGASSTAKRLALAYVLFKLNAAVIALVVFPIVAPLLLRASSSIDGVTLLAGYHTAYNVVGVAVLLPLIERFTRLVERIVPERASPLTRCLDPSALMTPIAAVEAVRRTVARALGVLCGAVAATLGAASRPEPERQGRDGATLLQASDALRQARAFVSGVSEPPASHEEQRRLTETLYALDYASRLSELTGPSVTIGVPRGDADDARARELSGEAMRAAVVVADDVAASHDPVAGPAASTAESLTRLVHCEKAMGDLRASHRKVTLDAVAAGTLTADEAIARVDTVRRLEELVRLAARSATHLAGGVASGA